MSRFNPASKLLHHGKRVQNWLEGRHVSPILVELLPTGFCNAKCPWCFFNGRKENASIDKELMFRILREIARDGVKAINWAGGGEPTLHPDFADFVSYARSLRLQQGLFTNGYKRIPHQDFFTWIRVSATDKGFLKVIPPKVKFGVVVNMTEDTDMIKLMTQAEFIGASYFQVRPALVGDYRKQPNIEAPLYLKNISIIKPEITEYKFREATLPKEYDKCYGWKFVPSIDWKGNLGFCCYRIHEKDYIIGNLNKNNFSVLMRTKKEPVVNNSCQNCCKNHEINKALYNAKRLTDRNFI